MGMSGMLIPNKHNFSSPGALGTGEAQREGRERSQNFPAPQTRPSSFCCGFRVENALKAAPNGRREGEIHGKAGNDGTGRLLGESHREQKGFVSPLLRGKGALGSGSVAFGAGPPRPRRGHCPSRSPIVVSKSRYYSRGPIVVPEVPLFGPLLVPNKA